MSGHTETVGKAISAIQDTATSYSITFSSVRDIEILLVLMVVACVLGIFVYEILAAVIAELFSGIRKHVDKRAYEHNKKYGYLDEESN